MFKSKSKIINVCTAITILMQTSTHASYNKIFDELVTPTVKKICKSTTSEFRDEIEEFIETGERVTGVRMPTMLRDGFVRPTTMQRISRFFRGVGDKISKTFRDIGICLGIVRRPTMIERIVNVSEDVLYG